MTGTQEHLILLDHCRLVHDDSLELSFLQGLRSRLAYRGHNDGLTLQNLRLKLISVLHEHIELLLRQLFDRLDIIAEEAGILGFELSSCLADPVNSHCGLVWESDILFANIDNSRELQDLVQISLADTTVELFDLIESIDHD